MPAFVILDSGELDSDYVGLTPTLLLNQGSLNINGLSYDAYDSDLAYNVNFLTYDGVFQWTATAESTFGSISSQSNVVITKIASGISQLGALQASSNESIINYAHASADLGSLSALSTSNIIKYATGLSQFGALLSESTSEIDNFDNATAQLGGLSASATYTIPTPPQPTPQLYGSSPYYKKIVKKKVKPQPEPIFKVEIEPLRPLPDLFKTHFAKIDTNLAKSENQAKSIIEFSILEDEAELLMLV